LVRWSNKNGALDPSKKYATLKQKEEIIEKIRWERKEVRWGRKENTQRTEKRTKRTNLGSKSRTLKASKRYGQRRVSPKLHPSYIFKNV